MCSVSKKQSDVWEEDVVLKMAVIHNLERTSPKTSNQDLTQSLSEYFDNVWQHNGMHTFKCMCNVMQRSLAIISIQLSSAAVCHYPQLPTDSPADSSGAPLRGIKRIVSTATCTQPFARYTFSNKNWQRNVISIQGAVAALSREKINCYLLGGGVWQLLNGRDNGFIIAPWSSLTGGNEPQITDGVGGEELMETYLKRRGHHLTRHRFLAGVRSKNDKMTL